MLSRLAITCKYFLVLLLLIFAETASAQNKYDAIGFRVDSLAAVGLPKSALKEVDKLDKLAHNEKNAAQQIRAVIYRATFQTYIEENALTAIIARLKKDITLAQYPARPVMQSILAEMYWNYYKENRREFNERSRLETVGEDYTKWDLPTIISETSRLYNLSLADAKQEQNTSINVLNDVLKGDKRVRYLRPTLYDLLAQRAFEFFLDDEPEIIKPKMAFSLNDPAFFSNAATFSKLPVHTTDTASTWYQGIRLLQQAIAFHLQTPDEEAFADLDLQRLRFLKDKSNALHKDSLYVDGLNGIAAKFSEKPVSSSALQLLGEYYKQIDSLKKAHQYFEKAKVSFPKSAGGLNAANQLADVEKRELSATVEDVNMPGKPILALLSYKNIFSVRFSVYRLSAKQVDILHGLTAADWNVQRAGLLERFSKNLKPVESRLLAPPNPGDYQAHTAEFSIHPLPVGSYFIVIEDQPSKGKTVSAIGDFSVSNLTYVIRKMPDGVNHVQVLNRVSGAVLSAIQVKVLGRVYDKKKGEYKRIVIASGMSDDKGIFTFRSKDSDNTILLSTKDDRLISDMGYISGYLETAESDVEPKPIERATLFTDRQIYRPGQTVYFKALLTTTLKGKSTLKPNEKLEVIFLGTQGQRISTLNLITNEFGTVAGSFVIPQNMLGGQLNISTGHGSINVTVEEYKRPTFQVAFLPVKEAYRFNDSVRVKGRVTAFSGYGISDATVALHVGRGKGSRKTYSRFVDYTGSVDAEITTDTIKTNNNGEFQFAFKATPADEISPDIYNYNITANVTDGSGESQTASQTVKVSNQVLNIDVDLPEKLSPLDSTKFALKFNNINDQLQNGSVKIRVSALSSPRVLFKKRVWDSPDQFILTKEDFIKQFPNYDWQHEGDKKYWAEAKPVIDKQITLTDSTTAMLDLGALKNEYTGIYKVVINAQNLKGDTVSKTYYISVHNQPANAANTGDWVTSLNDKVKKAGESVDFRIGLSSDSRVLVEKYEGARILSAEWITIGGNKQQTIKITVPATAKNNFAVQFLMVNDNRRYQLYQHLLVQDSLVKGLKVRFTTFRNKLQPGQKEQWKLQVSGTDNEKAEAEMLAGMYDASLDDILPARKWSVNLETGYNYYIPDYFEWQTGDLVSAAPTDALNEDYNWMPDYFIDYETLNWFGLDYEYGGTYNKYNSYIQSVKDHRKALAHDKHINELFIKNAALVKNGYVVSGRVLSSWGVPQADVKISIKGTGISVFSNSIGYYKIKVPYKATLIFTKKLFGTRYITAPVNGNIFIFWNSVRFPPPILADPGVKSQEGDPNTDVIISEPVANAGVAMVEDNAIFSAEDAPQPLANAKRNGYIANDKVVLREMAVKPGQKFDHELLQPSQQLSRPIVPRRNFNETAFFYPQLRTDDKGRVLIEFTIPEALTKWKFRAFAHNKQLQFGYTEADVVTQKQLSINANMPRFLREGDTVTISARLANLAATALKGKVELQLFNGINMQPVSLLMNKNEAQQQFAIDPSTTKPVSFKLVIPPALEALTYRLTADAGNFTDGEENTVPVLPNRMLVTESMPMMLRAGQSKTFSFDKLINQSSTTLKNKTLTLEYTQNPAWYAVRAIPYMMEFPYECSEQLFSRYYANSLSTDLIAKMPVIKQVFDRWKSSDSKELLSNLEKNQELKATLLEETPWLQDAISESEQKKRIAQLFDLNKMSYEMKSNLDKLKQKQLPDGSFPWFAGTYADAYITRHVLEGIGQLYRLKIASADNQTLKNLADKALGYMDAELLKNDKEAKKQKKYELRDVDADEVHAWYVRSYFKDNTLSAEFKTAFNNYLKRAEDQWGTQSVYQQGMIALTMARAGKLPVAKAIVKSLMETAQQSDDMGMYWGKNLMGYYWYQSPIETQSLMIALFTELGGNDKAVEEMKIWLMRNKQTNNWQTTKATAAAVYALLLKQESWLQATASSEIKIGGKPLADLKPDTKAEAGTGYIKTNWVNEQVRPAYGKVEVKNNGQSISYGAMHWQYLEQMDKISPSKTDVSLERKYFIKKQTDAGPVLQEVNATHQPKTGDLLKVVVYLKAGRDYEYVQLKDLRPAGTEPTSVLSDYKYQDGLWYYQVTKDVATNFFISHLNKGNYVFEYELRVAQPGNFSTGITSIQCMYAPEFNAHSEGNRVAFKP